MPLDPSRSAGLAVLRQRDALLPSSILLVAANLVPLAGVLFLGWSAFILVFVYWIEMPVIGFFTSIKIHLAGKRAPAPLWFFLTHFGLFTFAMYNVTIGYFGPGGYSTSFHAHDHRLAWQELARNQGEVWLAVGSFLVSHGFSFFFNYIGKKEWQNPKITLYLLSQPYGRLGVMIGTVVFTNLMVEGMRLDPKFGAVALVALKTWGDLWGHRREHRSS